MPPEYVVSKSQQRAACTEFEGLSLFGILLIKRYHIGAIVYVLLQGPGFFLSLVSFESVLSPLSAFFPQPALLYIQIVCLTQYAICALQFGII
jgi:hypothetical protein